MRILVADDEKGIRDLLTGVLSRADYEVQAAADGSQALSIAQSEPIDISLIDLQMPEMDGLELASRLKACHPDMDVIIVTGHGDREAVISALRAGVYDFLLKPLNIEELLASVRRASEKHLLLQENRQLRRRLGGKGMFCGLVGTSPVMQKLYRDIETFAPSDCNVLIVGESGSGKELTARILISRRYSKPLSSLGLRGGGL